MNLSVFSIGISLTTVLGCISLTSKDDLFLLIVPMGFSLSLAFANLWGEK